MLPKLSAILLLTAATAAVVFGQQVPEMKEPSMRKMPRVFVNPALESSYLGVQTREISRDNFAEFGLREPRGVAVEKVVENSPAAKAGLMNGDVIIKFNNADVTSVRQLTRLINEVAPDHQARITVLRGGGSEREVSATLGRREMPPMMTNGEFSFGELPAMPAMPNAPRAPLFNNIEPDTMIWRGGASRQIGVGVMLLTAQLGDYFGVEAGRGLLISAVRENSPAAKAGLKAGDVIVEADGREIKTSSDLTRIINDKKDGGISLTIIRQRARQNISVTPETIKGNTFNFEDLQKLGDNNPPVMNFEFQPSVMKNITRIL